MPCLSIFTQFCSYCSLVLLLKMFCFIQAAVKMCISTHSIYSANNSVAGERIRIPNARARRTDPGNVYVMWKSVRESVTYSVPLITLKCKCYIIQKTTEQWHSVCQHKHGYEYRRQKAQEVRVISMNLSTTWKLWKYSWINNCFKQLQFPYLLHTVAKLSMIHREDSQLSNETFP